MPSSVPDTCRINRALKGDWREWWRTEIPARIGGAGKGCVRRTRLEKKTVETSAARSVNKYKFNLEVHNNHLTIETIRKQPGQCKCKCVPVTGFQADICDRNDRNHDRMNNAESKNATF